MDHTVEKRLQAIEERNARVEFDKAWEVSWTRRFAILVVTYVVVALVLTRIHPEGAWIDAIIPCFGYILSTLSLPPIKAFWIKRKTKETQ